MNVSKIVAAALIAGAVGFSGQSFAWLYSTGYHETYQDKTWYNWSPFNGFFPSGRVVSYHGAEAVKEGYVPGTGYVIFAQPVYSYEK